MKTLVILAIFFMAASGFSFTSAPEKTADLPASVSASRPASDFSYFRAHRQGKRGVALAWGVTSAVNVDGFIIERSYDGDFFEVINQMSSNGSLKLNCKDENVFPGYIHYRVGCVMSDGSIHYTQVEIIRIVSHG